MTIRISLIDPRTGEPLRPTLKVRLRRDGLRWSIPLSLMVDSGSDYSIIPIEWVADYGLAMNLTDRTIRQFRTSTGSIGFAARGNLQLEIEGVEYSWPCMYSLPPGVTEENAEETMDAILRAKLRMGSRALSTPQSKSKPSTFGGWMKQQFPDLSERPALLGRRGFLEVFELRLNQDTLTIVRRSGVRRALQWCVDRAVWFLRLE